MKKVKIVGGVVEKWIREELNIYLGNGDREPSQASWSIIEILIDELDRTRSEKVIHSSDEVGRDDLFSEKEIPIDDPAWFSDDCEVTYCDHCHHLEKEKI